MWEGLAVHTQGGAYTRRCTHKAVHSHRKGLVIYPRIERSEPFVPFATDIELAYTPVTHAYGNSHNSQCIVLPRCSAAQPRRGPNIALTQGAQGGGGLWRYEARAEPNLRLV